MAVYCLTTVFDIFLRITTACLLLALSVQYCDSSLFHVLICMTDLCAQKSVHFLCLELRESCPKIYEKFGPEILLLLPGPNLVLKFHFLLPGRSGSAGGGGGAPGYIFTYGVQWHEELEC